MLCDLLAPQALQIKSLQKIAAARYATAHAPRAITPGQGVAAGKETAMAGGGGSKTRNQQGSRAQSSTEREKRVKTMPSMHQRQRGKDHLAELVRGAGAENSDCGNDAVEKDAALGERGERREQKVSAYDIRQMREGATHREDDPG